MRCRIWWLRRDSNPRPADYDPAALPTELPSQHLGMRQVNHVFRACQSCKITREVFVSAGIFILCAVSSVCFPVWGKGKKMTDSKAQIETAVVAGGCFWGVEDLIRNLPGVTETEVGYTGGELDNPNYEIVKTGSSGHAEAVQIKFDSKKTSYGEILKVFFRLHDPTTLNQQGNDKGTQYRSAIFYIGDKQAEVAKQIKTEVDKSGKWKKPVVTQIIPFKKFYPAETYHQDYLVKNPGGYTCHFLRD